MFGNVIWVRISVWKTISEEAEVVYTSEVYYEQMLGLNARIGKTDACQNDRTHQKPWKKLWISANKNFKLSHDWNAIINVKERDCGLELDVCLKMRKI